MLFVFFRILWNGWVAHERMERLMPSGPCLLGYGILLSRGLGRALCLLQDLLGSPPDHKPKWLEIQGRHQTKDVALLLDLLVENEDTVSHLAVGLYALYRAVNAL